MGYNSRAMRLVNLPPFRVVFVPSHRNREVFGMAYMENHRHEVEMKNLDLATMAEMLDFDTMARPKNEMLCRNHREAYHHNQTVAGVLLWSCNLACMDPVQQAVAVSTNYHQIHRVHNTCEIFLCLCLFPLHSQFQATWKQHQPSMRQIPPACLEGVLQRRKVGKKKKGSRIGT